MAYDILPDAFKLAFASQSGTTEFRVLTAQFGDGYNQRVPDGMNAIKQIWNVQTIPLASTDFETCVSFLYGKGGVTAFQWIPPGSDTHFKWICKSYTVSATQLPGQYAISATFERVFDL